MGTLDPRAVEGALADLDPDALTQFVADLWSARGRSAAITGRRQVRVDDGTGPARGVLVCPRLRVLTWNRLTTGWDRLAYVDALVTKAEPSRLAAIARGSETTVIDPEELARIATYALDEHERMALYRDHIGHPPQKGAEPDAGSPADLLNRVLLTVSSARQCVPRRYGSLRTAAILLCCVLVVVGVGSSQPVVGPGADAGGGEPTWVDGGDPPPHVAALSNGNVSALLDRHRQSLANESALLVVRHDGTRDGILTRRRWARSHVQLSQAGDGTWGLAVSGSRAPMTLGGEPREIGLTLTGTDQSCEGEPTSLGQAQMEKSLCSAVPSKNPVAAASSAYVDRYLNGEQLAVEDVANRPGGAYAVVSSVPPADMAPGVRNYTARAVVTPDGIVSTVTVSYRVPADAGEPRRTLSIQVSNRTARGAG